MTLSHTDTQADSVTEAAEWIPEGDVLSASFFARDSREVATDLVGKIVWRAGFGGGRLSEVEAYLPVGDPASHSAPGLTKRNAVMFGAPGHLYVFLSYGVHCLLNFVCDESGVGSAVLVRSYEPVGSGVARGDHPGARGPGLVGRALGVSLALNGLPLGPLSGVFVIDDGIRPAVGTTARIGISKGQELPLRSYMIDSPYVTGRGKTRGRGPR